MPIVTQFPTANEADPGDPDAWTSPGNAHADDGVDATGTANDFSSHGIGNQWKTFGFDGVIPVGATISAVKVIYEYGAVETGEGASLVTLTEVGGVLQGVGVTTSGPATYPTVHIHDHTADRAWTRADLLNSAFKVRVRGQGEGIAATSVAFQMDYVKVEVTYTGGVIVSRAVGFRRGPQPVDD